ncbi:MAG: phosphoglycerate dehydrogenase [Anaerolineaceae bacterium]|nr:phosphoglycerate dehydrogenase [Anaerolineaceae bacterium]
MPTVLLSAPYLIPFLNRFRSVLEGYGLELIVPEVHERLSEAELLGYAGQFDGVICGDDRFTAQVLEACSPRLKVISKWGTGIDSIDCKAAACLGVTVRNTPNAFTTPVSDSVLAYVLAFARRQPWMDREMKQGRWEKLPGRSLSECTLGVVGVGNVGKAVLHRAQAFGMRLLGNDIVPIAPLFLRECSVHMVAFEQLLAEADYISLNCDLNPTSFHLINAESLAQTKAGAVLINTARGPVVDEQALVAALASGHLGGAALDVFEVEPLPHDSPLLSMDNVLLAPHNSNSSPAAWEKVHWNTIRNLLDGLGIAHPGL